MREPKESESDDIPGFYHKPYLFLVDMICACACLNIGQL